MIASDIDGTLLDYDHIPGEVPAINWPLIYQIRERTDHIALISNQGGLPFGVMGSVRKDGGRYPTPEDFLFRLRHLADALTLGGAGIWIASIHVCIYHPKAPETAILTAQEALEDALTDWPAFVHGAAEWRKPSFLMLQDVGVTCYYGDSDEDEQAAGAIGIEFVRVERFSRRKCHE